MRIITLCYVQLWPVRGQESRPMRAFVFVPYAVVLLFALVTWPLHTTCV